MKIGQKLLWGLESLIVRGSPLGNPPVFDKSLFPWTAELEEQWPAIRKELDTVLERKDELPSIQEISPDQRYLSQDDRWKTYFFQAFDVKADGNRSRCPETTKVLDRIPQLKTAMFSILEPGKHIKPHRGVFKGVIRCHLGLRVPSENPNECGIAVGGHTLTWREGGCIVFDDTHRHEAWNHTDRIRVVLLIDVVRPLRFPVNLLNGFLLFLIRHSPFVSGALQNYHKWEKRFEEAINAPETGSTP